MKTHILLLIFLSTTFTLHSQKDLNFVYLFDDFEKGTATFKSGNVTQNLFNYELISQRIHFKSEQNTILELRYPESIEYINIGEYTFEHVKGSTFYQKINFGNLDLYIQHMGTLTSKGKYVGFGGYSTTASVDNLSLVNTDGTGTYTKLENNEMFKVEKKFSFYLKVNEKFKRFYSIDSLAKLFKKEQGEIKKTLKEENVDFRKVDDVIRAIKYCNQFTQ